MDALRNGRTIATNGPLAIMEAKNELGRTEQIGGEITGRKLKLIISARSSEEFGEVDKIILYRGNLDTGRESHEKVFIPRPGKYDHVFEYEMTRSAPGYVRLETTSSTGNRRYMCLSNPIWFRLA